VKGNGASETTYSKEMETDPKGLMNKSTAKVEETTKRAADGSSTRVVKKEVDGKVVEESVH
ncbi:MAG: hypothetical protein J0M12_16785, partial [Deltaproteobacteria bacterium]|nr:hypothetical protein [Deltaproteobacteria bacterium]